MNISQAEKALLVVAVSPAVVGRFPPMLWRGSFDVMTVANPRLAIKAIEQREFTLIITNYPLPDFDFQRFLDEVRAYGSPCRKTPVIAVISQSEKGNVDSYIGRGLNRKVLESDSDDHLAEVIASILSVAPRVAVRFPIDIQTTIRRHDRKMIAQTINVSRSGILITDPGSLGPGDQVEFRFEIEGPGAMVGGTAEVVRVERRRTKAAHVGLRIVDFLEPDERLFYDLVDSLLEEVG